jgi:Nif-specific regulatory protein
VKTSTASSRLWIEAIEGPRRGERFPLADREMRIGRDPANDVTILDGALSRHHCSIVPNASGFLLRDHQSRNHTFVNENQVTVRRLRPGDRIRLGKTVFVVGEGDEPQADPETAVISHAAPDALTIVLRPEQNRYVGEGGHGLRADSRTVHDLDLLLHFSREITAERQLERLMGLMARLSLEAAPADRAAVLLYDEGDTEPASMATAAALGGEEVNVTPSPAIAHQVLETGAAVLSNEAPGGQRALSAVLAVPLPAQGKTLGMLYLESAKEDTRFDEDHLELVTAMGCLAALAIANAQQIAWLEVENRRLQSELGLETEMVGNSAAMKKVYQFIARVAPRDTTTLITGESGTGKELVARAIHRNSARANKPFLAINCAAIAENLLESELFGHEKGAFTGADLHKRGKFEVANGGTVFLDEIGELAPALQAKLLRVLQEREMERVGGTKTIPLDIRVIAATNRDLLEASRNKTFREDLYYRLNVISIRTPALRERREDIPALAGHFARRHGEKMKRRITGISAKARACLMSYDWPGNVRELDNVIERAVVLGSTDTILPEDLPDNLLAEAAPAGEPVTALHDGIREAKKQMIQRAVEQTGGNYTEAAVVLGVHPNHLFRLVRTLNLKPKRSKA